MKKIIEKDLEVSLPDEWLPVKMDAEQSFFKKLINRIPNQKVVDIVAIYETGILMIELSDLRKARNDDKLKLRSNQMEALEFAHKVFDTTASLYAAHRFSDDSCAHLTKVVFGTPDNIPLVAILVFVDHPDRVGSNLFQKVHSDMSLRATQLLSGLKLKCMVVRPDQIPTTAGWSVCDAASASSAQSELQPSEST
ncbi:hypothetical protein [Skermanella pratensis]|uniref:hypothetical protein n=1 Tax=Skermanella pratensis TaxID=2233999 RepID=UPI0013015B1B|nr:hypothetical protein [Skermanella pratensis]